MPRAPKKCGRAGCEERGTSKYCTRHTAEAQQRGNTTHRGYGWTHQKTRADWAAIVATGTVTCWRCNQLIQPGEGWHLGHDDTDRTITRGPEHDRRCNLSTAGRRSHHRNPRQGTSTPGHQP